MSPEDEKYYENYFDTFATEGWKQFVEEIESILDGHRIEDIRDEQNLAYIKGERAALMRVRRFAGSIRNNYDLILERQNA